MAGQLPAITDLIPSSATLSPAQVLETRASSLRRMATLLRLARGAWTLAVYESSDVQRLMVEDLRQAVAPLPLIEIALDREETPDPLRIVRRIDLNGDAPVLSFHGIGRQLAELAGFLDIQRDALARHPHRLIFWTSERERRQLSEAAPNFYSRLSGVYYFPGGSHVAADNSSASRAHPTAGLATTGPEFAARRRRPYLPESEGRQRDQQIAFLNDRIQELHDLPRPNFEAIGDAWYDLAGVYERSMPRRWLESESAYAEAARAYAQSGLTLAEAEAHYQAGDAAMRGYGHHAALDHLATALRLYRLLAHSLASTPDAALGEANVLKAQGDVLAFLAQREEALARYGEALTLFRAVGDRLGEANVLQAQGDVLYFLKQTEEALARYGEALTLFRAVGDRLGEANVLRAQGDVLAFLDQREEALARYGEALTLFRAVGSRLGEANVLRAQGDVLAFLDQREEALARYGEALTLFRAVGSRLGEANVLQAQGDVLAFL
ncbi:MAG TPA: tetratricopeptide repeat protein, partial [Anaerolineae bacterium]|nr:tetratricopeptide repeat protein [Anaerolineae bacterium]